MINKIKYLYYSRIYIKIIDRETINKIRNANFIYFGRKNGKTILTISYLYIRLVENHEFKAAKKILKEYKKIYRTSLF